MTRRYSRPWHLVAGGTRPRFDLRARLAQDPDPWVRAGVAAAPRCPRAVLRGLLRDPTSVVRGKLVSRANLSASALLELALRPPEETLPHLEEALAKRLLERLDEVAQVATLAQVRDLLRTDPFRYVGRQLALAVPRHHERHRGTRTPKGRPLLEARVGRFI